MRIIVVLAAIWFFVRRSLFDPPHPTKDERERHTKHAVSPLQNTLPQASDANFRVYCNEVAEQLSKNLRFKWQVILAVVAALAALAAVMAGIIGWNISSSIKDQLAVFQAQTSSSIKDQLAVFQAQTFKEMSEAKKSVETEIANQFKTENVRATVSSVASEQAKLLLKESVEPSITAFQKALNEKDSEFRSILQKTSDESKEKLQKLDEQLATLRRRNEISALADKAISEGDIWSYRELESIAYGTADSATKNAAMTELISVFHAYSPFGPTRIAGVAMDVKAFNIQKSKLEELTPEDIIPKWPKVKTWEGRAKLAQIMASTAREGSYSTAEFLCDAIKSEFHLEALRYLGDAFQRVTRQKGGKLDKKDLLDWWEKNREAFKASDSDPKPSMTPNLTPSS